MPFRPCQALAALFSRPICHSISRVFNLSCSAMASASGYHCSNIKDQINEDRAISFKSFRPFYPTNHRPYVGFVEICVILVFSPLPEFVNQR